MAENDNHKNGQTAIEDAPPGHDGPAPVAAPTEYSAEFVVETEHGYHVAIKGEHLQPRDLMSWIKATDKTLADQGVKPVRRDLVVNVAASSAPRGGAGEAVELPGENGGPPSCSLHGPMKWIQGQRENGSKYAFWGCQTRGCRPKKQT